MAKKKPADKIDGHYNINPLTQRGRKGGGFSEVYYRITPPSGIDHEA
jgi:hypothetical protein